MATKKTFYIVSDNIQTKSKDKTRINAIAKAFQSIGHKTVVGDVGSNVHTKPKSYGCTKKNDVWVCVFGGACAGTIADLTGYTGFGEWFKKDQLKNARLMFIFMSRPEGRAADIASIKKLGISKDDDFSKKVKNFTGIKNPSNYLLRKGVTWIEDGTTAAIVNKIKNKQFNGSGLDLEGNGSSSSKEITTSYTISHGFDKQKPFSAYLRIDYALGKPDGPVRAIFVDWSSEAPDSMRHFDNDYNIEWQNNRKFIHEIDLLSHIKTAEKDYSGTKNTKYYLKKVTFLRDFPDVPDDVDTEEKENLLYDDNDRSSYKMLLYDLGVSNGEIANMENLGVCGKTVLDGMKSIIEKSNYEFTIKYGLHRNNDYINFTDGTESKDIKYTFNEGFNGNIIGISNVQYSPTAQLTNSAVTIFKSQYKEDVDLLTYRYSKRCKFDELLRFGEQMKVENSSNNMGWREATQRSYDKLMEYFQPITTFTVKCVGCPPIDMNDWVETKTINPLLTNEYQVASRKVIIDVEDRPMIQTEFGLGDIDAPIKVKRNLANQRKKLVRQALDLNEPVVYDDSFDDDNIWVE